MIRYYKQPDGLIAIWTTIADGFLTYNCTLEEAIYYMVYDRIDRDNDLETMTDIIYGWYNGYKYYQVWNLDLAVALQLMEANHPRRKKEIALAKRWMEQELICLKQKQSREQELKND